ncbi:MAG: LemA family protein [Candidatus Woesearchaeota archaeon]
MWFWIILGVIVLYVVLSYNRLVVLKNRVKNAWAQIDVQLKRRIDLIPNLVETVKGYVKHEKQTLQAITEARNMLSKAQTIREKAKANSALESTLKTLFAVVENYPKLKANENFMMLQEELAGTENKIAYARQFYNDAVMMLNTAIEVFPTNIIAKMFGFKKEELFEVTAEERKAPKVKFD